MTRSSLTERSLRCLLVGGLLIVSAGCLGGLKRQYVFSGTAPYTTETGAGQVTAHGVATGKKLSVHFLPDGSAPPRLNYLLDEYTAKVYDGRTLVLDKGPVTEYPDIEMLNSKIPVVLRLPKGVSGHDLVNIDATIHYGSITIPLTPIRKTAQEPLSAPGYAAPARTVAVAAPSTQLALAPSAPASAAPGGAAPAPTVLAPGAPAPAVPMRVGPAHVATVLTYPVRAAPEHITPVLVSPAPLNDSAGSAPTARVIHAPTTKVVQAQAPSLPAPWIAADAARTEPTGPPGSVPVDVMFEQELGTRLVVATRWNEEEPVPFSAGERQTFHLMPGQHELAFSCHMQGIATTAGSLPLTVRPRDSVRVAVGARARLTGAVLRVRIWQNDVLVANRRFTPKSGSGRVAARGS